MNAYHHIIGKLFTAACSALFLCQAQAAKNEPAPPSSLFQTGRYIELSYTPKYEGPWYITFKQTEVTPEKSSLGYTLSSTADPKAARRVYHSYMYCACKRNDSCYDVYFIPMQAAKDSHVLHRTFFIFSKYVTGRFEKGNEVQFNTIFTQKGNAKNIEKYFNEHKGGNDALTRDRLRAISTSYAGGGDAAVKQLLKWRWCEDSAKFNEKDYE